MTSPEIVAVRVEGQTWHRAAELLGVSFPERMIELVVIPYEKTIDVNYAGRPVKETIQRGAFDGVQRRPNRVHVNVDHDPTTAHTIGKAVSLHPSRDEGLVAHVKIARTQLGSDVLELAADGMIGASAGFEPMRGGLQWDGRDSYRVVKAFLRHIAMTPIPAYTDARVLSVRREQPAARDTGSGPPMPVLAAIEYELAAAELAAIDARYGVRPVGA